MARILDSGKAFNAAEPYRAMPHLIDTEVLIVGGGPAGAAAAIELAVWDLNAKLADEPACVRLLSTPHNRHAPAMHTTPTASIARSTPMPPVSPIKRMSSC